MKRNADIVDARQTSVASIALTPPRSCGIAKVAEDELHDDRLKLRIEFVAWWNALEDQPQQIGKRFVEFAPMVDATVRNVGNGDRREVCLQLFRRIDLVEEAKFVLRALP